ncbi:MAG: Rrf2 family transcriptional regulator [Candidatus Margulisiibacteriota bacterium]
MKLTTKGEYAVRSLIYLLHNSNGKPVQIRDISLNEGISKNYIEQLFMCLRNGGILKSLRGPSGGYIFTRSPDRISVGDIIRCVEGPVHLALCSSGKPCSRMSGCRSYPVWKKINRKIEAVLDSFKLGDL